MMRRMSAPADFPPIAKDDLFARLAGGTQAGVCVVTPNRRLALELERAFDARCLAQGLARWEAPDIQPLPAFVARCYDDALHAEGGEALPLLLADAQAREIWEKVIAESESGRDLLDLPQTAARALESWRLAHAWNIAGALDKFEAGEDARAFATWAREYARRLRAERCTDGALLPGVVAGRFARRPRTLVAYAFDIVTPQAAAFLAAACDEVLSCAPAARAARVSRHAAESPRAELELAAAWARARLEAGARRIGVVVPDLQRRRSEVVRVFARTMRPDFNLPGAAPAAQPFNLSLGEPLATVPLVAFALGMFDFALHEVEFECASRLLRSPFLGGAESELAARARLDARLRRDAPPRASLPKLIGRIEHCPLLRARLEAAFAVKPAGRAPHDWAQYCTALLAAAGFPGERTLDSAEYQARERFHALLGEFAQLTSVAPRLTSREALGRLRRLCTETLFQAEAPAAPVQVLGLLESAGLEFDCLWVAGLTDAAWPLAARPNPLLPVGLQKKAGIPEAAAETSLELDRRLTAGWAGAAAEVVFSSPRKDGERAFTHSPLIDEFTADTPAVAMPPRLRDAIFAARAQERTVDDTAPPLAAAEARGGTRVLADQAACPFRAFARWRLDAQALDSPVDEPDGAARGRLVHAFMAALWRTLGGRAALDGDVAPALAAAARAAAAEVGLAGRFAELEIGRLQRLGAEWLALERERTDFEVASIEEPRALVIGGLALKGRIDRMDRLAGGGHALIDYKTATTVSSRAWTDERPDDPQLPLYAVTAAEEVTALAFAKVRAGDMRFSGFSADGGVMPQVKASPDWDALRAGWHERLEALAGAFMRGRAAVDPKRGLQTCRNCDLQTLCRVHELLAPGEEAEEGES
jgi:ATP-dependent helicase/nuclease subunit B